MGEETSRPRNAVFVPIAGVLFILVPMVGIAMASPRTTMGRQGKTPVKYLITFVTIVCHFLRDRSIKVISQTMQWQDFDLRFKHMTAIIDK